uniref:Uncharacterized protein n=1 Tax=Oryza brachyantha TaxID=4533 RepID=J3MIE4_ORYBR
MDQTLASSSCSALTVTIVTCTHGRSIHRQQQHLLLQICIIYYPAGGQAAIALVKLSASLSSSFFQWSAIAFSCCRKLQSSRPLSLLFCLEEFQRKLEGLKRILLLYLCFINL